MAPSLRSAGPAGPKAAGEQGLRTISCCRHKELVPICRLCSCPKVGLYTAVGTYSCSCACRKQGLLLETWIVMEYADRGNLADALRSGRFPSHDFIAIYRCLLDIAAGVCPFP